MTVPPRGTWSRLAAELRTPVAAAFLLTGVVRVGLSVREACEVLQCDDFGRFWYATSGWLKSGTSIYAATPASMAGDGVLHTNLNLPSTHLLFLPFSLLPLPVAATLWIATGLLALAASLRIVARETGWRPSLGWAAIFVWWMPTHVQAVTGQVAWVLLLPVTLGWAAARRGAWVSSGIWIGVAIAIKPFLTPLVAWLVWRRQFAGALAALTAAGGVTLAGAVAFGVNSLREWQDSIAAISWYATTANASLWGLTYRLFTINPEFRGLVYVPELAPAIAVALSLIAVVAAWLVCRRSRTLDGEWTAVLSATLLISPLGWVYYGVLLVPGWKARWPGIAATACWLLPTPWLAAGQPSVIATALWGSAAFWGLVLAAVYAGRQAIDSPA